MTSFKDWRSEQLMPAPLQKTWGKRWNQTLGTVADNQVNAAQQAALAGFIDTAPIDALQYLGSTRQIDRYPADTDATYRARLKAAWTTWPQAGTYDGILGQLHAFGFSNVEIYDVNASSPPVMPWPPQPQGPKPSWWGTVFPAVTWPATAGANSAKWWSRYWVVLTQPFPTWLNWSIWHYGDGHTYGELGPDGTPYVYGLTATTGQINSIRSLLRKWEPCHTLCSAIWLDFGGGTVIKIPGRENANGY